MSELKAWWGALDGREAVVVARSGPEAAKLAKIKPADLPFRFEPTVRPHNADKSGVYRQLGGVGIWVRETPRQGSARPGGAMRSIKATVDWAQTLEGDQKYREARAEAQRKANESGFDHGLERNDLFEDFHVFMLPRRENRYGHELRCEVVSCEFPAKCQPGHGYG